MQKNRRLFTTCFALFLTLAASSALWAQQKSGASTEKSAKSADSKTAKGAVSFDIAPELKSFIATNSDTKTSFFGFAAAYEHPLKNNHSVGGRAEFIFSSYDSVKGMYFGLDVHGRWYPLAAFEKVFIDMSVGFNTARVDNKEFLSGVTFGGKVGWKYAMSKKVFFEPSMGYYYSKYGGETFPTIPLGWQLGIAVGISL